MQAESVISAHLNGDATIVLLSRDSGGRRVVRNVPAEWVAYFKSADIDTKHARDLRTSVYVRSLKVEGDWLRVGFVNRIARDDYCNDRRSAVSQLGIATYEADVSPIVRYMVDSNSPIAKPRPIYLDIESDSRCTFAEAKEGKARILSWVLIDGDERVQAGVLSEDTDRAEKHLLDRLWTALRPYDQVVAWNGDEFDFPVIFSRSEQRGCEVNANDWLWLDMLELFERMNKNASESGDEKTSMALQSIAQAILGEGKEETPPEVVERFGKKPLGTLTWPLWEAGGEFRDILLKYNIKDTDLLRRIEKETGYIALFSTLCEVCHIFGDSRGINPTHQMDGFMLRLGLERNYHFATKRFREGTQKFKGAFVMDPETHGIEHDVHVCDFASLYPSIILTWNMSPDTKVYIPKGQPRPENVCLSPLTGIHFTTDSVGILPVAVAELIRLRKHWNDLKSSFAPGTDAWHDANRKSTAYKVAANSFYGVLGSPYSRFFDPAIGESVTQCGKWLILETIKEVEKRGWKSLYADTDSVFVKGCTNEEYAAFTKWCNTDLYPRILKEVGCATNTIKLAYEKAFSHLVIVTAKRYCGTYSHFKGTAATADSKPEIKGLEYKRGDATVLARDLQSKVVDLLCGGLKLSGDIAVPTDLIIHYQDLIIAARKHVLDEPLTIDEIRVSKSLSKPLKDYVVKTKVDGTKCEDLAHVRIAKILLSRGAEIREGTRVEYIITDGSCSPQKVIPADDYTGQEVDRFHIWESQVFPPTQRLLEAAFPEEDWLGWLRVRPAKVRAPRKKKQSPQLPD
jgi:DNA polymerase, archaea type